MDGIEKFRSKKFLPYVSIDWMSLFISKNVTPYMHILVVHFPTIMKDHGMFSQKGLELNDDDITKDYFKSTNHKIHCNKYY